SEMATPAQHIVLGTGEAEFEPIIGEPTLTLVAGVQGGFHVWASFLAYDFVGPRMNFEVATSLDDDPATRLVMHAQPTARDSVDDEGEAVLTFAGFPAQIKDARCANERRVHVELTVADKSGRTASDSRYCIADVPVAYRQETCP